MGDYGGRVCSDVNSGVRYATLRHRASPCKLIELIEPLHLVFILTKVN